MRDRDVVSKILECATEPGGVRADLQCDPHRLLPSEVPLDVR